MIETLHGGYENEVWQKQHEVVPVPNERIRHEVLHYAALCLPDYVYWCGGTQEERRVLKYEAVTDAGERAPAPHIIGSSFVPDPNHPATDRLPGADAKSSLRHLFHRSMNGRTMYVVPFVIQAEGSNPPVAGVQLTDSAYLASQIEEAFPSGDTVWAHLTAGTPFWLCLHATGPQIAVAERVQWELPAEKTLWAYGPDYGVHTLRRVIHGT